MLCSETIHVGSPLLALAISGWRGGISGPVEHAMPISALQIAIGLACIAFGCASFWYLLPRHGRIHPLVARWDGGSMLTLGVMTVVTVGIIVLIGALFE